MPFGNVSWSPTGTNPYGALNISNTPWVILRAGRDRCSNSQSNSP